MTIQAINIGTAPNDNTGDDPRTAGQKINSNFSTATHAASREVGVLTGNIPDADALSMVGAAENLTNVNTNRSMFGFSSGALISNGFPRNTTNLRVSLSHEIVSATGVNVTGPLSVVDTEFNTVKTGIQSVDISVISSGSKVIFISISNLTGLVIDKPYLLLAGSGLAGIEVQ